MTTKPWEHLKGPRRLRRWRTQVAKLQQTELAKLVGTDPARVSRYESGDSRPNLDIAAIIHKTTRGYVSVFDWADIKP